MKEIFQDISDRLTAEVTAIRWIDFDLGQFEMDPPPVSWPCVLIGFGDAAWSTFSQNIQEGQVNINIRVGFRLFERTHSKTNQTFRDEALEHLDTVSAVHRALQGFSGECFAPLNRISQSNEKRADYRVYNIGYVCTLWDEPTATFVPPGDLQSGFVPGFEIENDIVDTL